MSDQKKYEYVTVPLLTHATKQILDTWGSEGWELVQVVPAPGGGDREPREQGHRADGFPDGPRRRVLPCAGDGDGASFPRAGRSILD